MKEHNKWRYKSLGLFLTAIALVIIGQLIRIQFDSKAKEIIDHNDIFIGEWITLHPARGEIRDRWGHLLAGNKTVYEVGVHFADVQNPETIALASSLVLDLDYNQILSAIKVGIENENYFYYMLADFVLVEKKEQLEKWSTDIESLLGGDTDETKQQSLEGLVYRSHLQRSYPEMDLASNVLGFVTQDGKGYLGVEEEYNRLLAGEPLRVWVPLDPNRVEELPDVPDGVGLILTIDREIQVVVENILDSALEQSGASNGTIVVMHPKSGEILAMASTPRINLNEYWRYGEVFSKFQAFNLAVWSYEPGSVFKVLTMAAAIDNGDVQSDTYFFDTGEIEIGGNTIRNWDRGAWGEQDMIGCLQHSLNVCLAWVALQLGAEDFYQYLQDFGFGHPTGIELADERRGLVKLPGDDNWHESDLGTNAFGQGISVTPIQMLMAISAIANDGKMVTPHVLRAIVDDGVQFESSEYMIDTPITTETAREITRILAISLENEASSSLVDGYRLAGKTGTAEIPTEFGYTSDLTNASFVGWGPIDDPQFLVYVWLEKPSISPWGSVVAAPVFRQVVQRLVVLMDIPPDDIRLGLNSP